ncbi:hypothetical protein E2320_000906, partial [Naja naja]
MGSKPPQSALPIRCLAAPNFHMAELVPRQQELWGLLVSCDAAFVPARPPPACLPASSGGKCAGSLQVGTASSSAQVGVSLPGSPGSCLWLAPPCWARACWERGGAASPSHGGETGLRSCLLFLPSQLLVAERWCSIPLHVSLAPERVFQDLGCPPGRRSSSSTCHQTGTALGQPTGSPSPPPSPPPVQRAVSLFSLHEAMLSPEAAPAGNPGLGHLSLERQPAPHAAPVL